MPLRLYLGHGASGSSATMQPFVVGLAARGLEALALDLPRRRAEDAVSRWLELAPPGVEIVAGGHSYGGRVASLAAATLPAAAGYRGLVCFSYPLHRPGAAELGPRIAHWPVIPCPVLLLSGESDPFARIDLLREAVERLPDGRLVTYAGLGHGLGPVLDDVLDRVAAFVGDLPDPSAARRGPTEDRSPGQPGRA